MANNENQKQPSYDFLIQMLVPLLDNSVVVHSVEPSNEVPGTIEGITEALDKATRDNERLARTGLLMMAAELFNKPVDQLTETEFEVFLSTQQYSIQEIVELMEKDIPMDFRAETLTIYFPDGQAGNKVLRLLTKADIEAQDATYLHSFNNETNLNPFIQNATFFHMAMNSQSNTGKLFALDVPDTEFVSAIADKLKSQVKEWIDNPYLIVDDPVVREQVLQAMNRVGRNYLEGPSLEQGL